MHWIYKTLDHVLIESFMANKFTLNTSWTIWIPLRIT